MTTFDIVVLLLLIGGAVLGSLSGFVKEVLSLFAWGAAIFALKMLHAPASHFLAEIVNSRGGGAVLAFVLVFGAVFLAGKLVATSIGRRTRQSILGPLDRVLGAGFGVLKGLLVATVGFMLVNLLLDMWSGKDAVRPQWMRDARTYPLLNASSRAVVDFVHYRRGDLPGREILDRTRLDNAQGNGAI
ncbi:CvpA family protein [Sphingomonas bacterium]|uniref:CvpA family protein n=1 Tax=Sphingomonas bacterium TaxID=1895847 RepID=UPI0015758A70|nr:CvpA family protein [Sphingomonas bacterium]